VTQGLGEPLGVLRSGETECVLSFILCALGVREAAVSRVSGHCLTQIIQIFRVLAAASQSFAARCDALHMDSGLGICSFASSEEFVGKWRA
jgi:hypothetical protein